MVIEQLERMPEAMVDARSSVLLKPNSRGPLSIKEVVGLPISVRRETYKAYPIRTKVTIDGISEVQPPEFMMFTTEVPLNPQKADKIRVITCEGRRDSSPSQTVLLGTWLDLDAPKLYSSNVLAIQGIQWGDGKKDHARRLLIVPPRCDKSIIEKNLTSDMQRAYEMVIRR